MVPLDELCDIVVGRTPARANPEYWGQGAAWLSIADMSQGHLVTGTKEQITAAAAKQGRLVDSGTVLLSFKLSIGKVAIAGVPLYTNEAIAALPIRDQKRLDERYLLRALQGMDLAQSSNRAAMGATLNKAKLREIQIPVPPLTEQRRIAGTLDQADAIRARRRQVLAHFDSLTQSIFHDMFGRDEATAEFGDVAEIQGGLQVSAKRAALPVEVPYLRVANAHRGRLDLAEVKTLRATEAEVDRTRLRKYDLLFVEGHANPLEVGRVAMWDGSVAGCVHQNHLIRGRIDKQRLLPVVALHWFNSVAGADHFRRAGRTTSGLNTISASTVRSAPIVLPDRGLQTQFADRVRQIEGTKSRLHAAVAADGELFASLQSRAFRGEL